MTNIRKYRVYILSTITLIIVAGIFILQTNKPQEYKVGIMLPLSGPSASIGERAKNGIELAISDIKQKGVTISPIFNDDKGESATAVSIVNKLINVDSIKVIIGTLKSDPLLAIAPIAEKNKVLVLSPTAGASAISQAGDFIFRNIETPDIHGIEDSKFFKDRGIEKVAILMANASNAQSYGNSFVNHFKELGIITDNISYNQDEIDFRTILIKILEKNPDGIFIGVATAKDAGIIVKQIREIGYKGTILMSVAADAKEFFEIAGKYSNDSYVSVPYFNPEVEPAKSFNISYNQKYGTTADAFSANSYDAMMLVYNAIDKCGDLTKSLCTRDYLYSVKDYNGVGGLTSFDQNGDVVKPIGFKVAMNGKFISVEKKK
jgi:branched-chain amino acid transport system substrate-binding protein